jgi:hypothetical protein
MASRLPKKIQLRNVAYLCYIAGWLAFTIGTESVIVLMMTLATAFYFLPAGEYGTWGVPSE